MSKLKNVLAELLPPIILKGIPKKKVSLEYIPLPIPVSHSEKAIIIGNGPSLNKSIELYKDEIVKYDCFSF